MLTGMSGALTKQAKAKKSNVKSTQKITASTVRQDVRGQDSLKVSWTDRPDSLKMLVECAALLGIADKLDSTDPSSSPDELATRAVKLIQACEFSLKLEAMQAEVRVRDQLGKLKDMTAFRTHLSFEAGAKALLKLSDARPERLDVGIKRLLKSDFESHVRPPRSLESSLDEYRPLKIFPDGEKPQAPTLECFIATEFAWYQAKGFDPKDLKRLSKLVSKMPAEEA
jgi:hypothetical protein